ncbi:hypothetical protein ACS0TY_029407 [Phlomoides rotata]
MSTKVVGLSSSYYFSSRSRSDGKPRSISPLLPTIKRSKMIDQTLDLFKLSAQYGNSMWDYLFFNNFIYIFCLICVWFDRNYKSRVISKPGNFQVKASASENTPSSSSWKKWLVGILLTVFLPSVGFKGGQLLYLKSKIDKAVETVEHAVEVVEEVAEEAERMVEEMEEKLPGDSKLRKTLESFDDLAKKAVHEAKLAEDVVHKVKDMEEEIEESLKKAALDKLKK